MSNEGAGFQGGLGACPQEISRILTPLSPLSQVSELLTVKQGLDSDK